MYPHMHVQCTCSHMCVCLVYYHPLLSLFYLLSRHPRNLHQMTSSGWIPLSLASSPRRRQPLPNPRPLPLSPLIRGALQGRLAALATAYHRHSQSPRQPVITPSRLRHLRLVHRVVVGLVTRGEHSHNLQVRGGGGGRGWGSVMYTCTCTCSWRGLGDGR